MRLLPSILVTLLAISFPVYAEASVAGTAAKSAMKRAMPKQVVQPMRVAPKVTIASNKVSRLPATKPRDVLVPRSRYPESAAHIEHAQRMGQPTVLTLDRARAAERRAASLKFIKRNPNKLIAGKDRDEYPPALVREGGFNANVRFIKARDNRGAGKAMERQVHDLPNGARIRVLVTP